MQPLPIAISVPHTGLLIPNEVKEICLLTEQEVIDDGDEGADMVYTPLKKHVAIFQKADVARAIIDLNRATDDFRKDGVIKSHTCWDVPVYSEFPGEALIQELITKYYQPYHQVLADISKMEEIVACIDCHTMAAHGPPVGPDPGKERPFICLGNVNHQTCPQGWIELLAELLTDQFSKKVLINSPFSGGHITQRYGKKKNWLQLELSRTAEIPNSEKSSGILIALQEWCSKITR